MSAACLCKTPHCSTVILGCRIAVLLLPGIFLVLGLMLTAVFAINTVGAMLGNLVVLVGIFLLANIPTFIF